MRNWKRKVSQSYLDTAKSLHWLTVIVWHKINTTMQQTLSSYRSHCWHSPSAFVYYDGQDKYGAHTRNSDGNTAPTWPLMTSCKVSSVWVAPLPFYCRQMEFYLWKPRLIICSAVSSSTPSALSPAFSAIDLTPKPWWVRPSWFGFLGRINAIKVWNLSL